MLACAWQGATTCMRGVTVGFWRPASVAGPSQKLGTTDVTSNNTCSGMKINEQRLHIAAMHAHVCVGWSARVSSCSACRNCVWHTYQSNQQCL
jgi:hypothetical protein